MSLSQDQVRHIAKLARLELSDQEISKFSGQLNTVFQYMEVLNEADTRDLEITSQVTGLENVTREDTVCEFVGRDELLACSELAVEQNQIRVKPAIEQ